MRVRFRLALLLALALGACSTVEASNPLRLDTVAPASHLSPHVSGHGLADLDHQVDLVAIIVSALQRDRTSAWKFAAGTPPIATETQLDAHTVYLGGPAGEALDRLIPVVEKSSDPQAVRNAVVEDLIAASTGNCLTYLKSLRGTQVGSRLTFDFLSGSLATASSLVKRPYTGKLLAGLSAASISDGASIDRNIFAQQAAESISDAIVRGRDEQLVVLRHDMARPYAEWPLGMAIADVFAFHGECSVMRGLTRVNGALDQRERAVRAIREAAAQVQRNSQVAPAVLAVIASMETGENQADSEFRLPSDWRSDLEKIRDNEIGCMEAVEKAMSKDTTLVFATEVAKATNANCLKVANDWAGLDASTNFTALSPPSPLAAGAKADAEAAYRTALRAKFDAVEQSYTAQANAKIVIRAAARAGAADALRGWNPAASKTNVYVFLRSFAGLPAAVPAGGAHAFSPALDDKEIASLDPVLVYAIATAYLAAQDSASPSPAVALQALNAAEGRYKALES